MKFPSFLALAAAFSALLTSGLHAQNITTANATTIPVGVVTVTIAAGTGSIYTQTAFSAPMLQAGNLTGQVVGRVTGVTNNTLSNGNAGWANSTMAVPGSPYFIHLTSGNASGRMFQISANNQTTLTVTNTQGVNLTSLGIIANSTGDSYEIVEGDTLLGILGTSANGIIGGNFTQFNASTIDKVAVNDPNTGAVFSCYYDTSVSQWRRFGSKMSQSNLVVSPRSGIHYSRIGNTSINLTCLGTVPAEIYQQQTARAGTIILASFFPVHTTLGSLGIENIPNWKRANQNGETVENSDRVILKSGSVFFSYYYDHALSQWRRFGSVANQGNVAVTVGSAPRLVRSGAVGFYDTWTRAIPYSLN